jgi:hypothetical protein
MEEFLEFILRPFVVVMDVLSKFLGCLKDSCRRCRRERPLMKIAGPLKPLISKPFREWSITL